MDKIKVQWLTEDASLNASLTKAYPDGFEISPFGLLVFRRLTWLADSPEARANFVYGHIVRQEESYGSEMVETLCGEGMSLYSVGDIYPMVDVKPLNDSQLCENCAIKAEFLYWFKLHPTEAAHLEDMKVVPYGL